MITSFHNYRHTLLNRILSGFIAFSFSFSLVLPPGYAQLIPQTILNLPAPGTMVTPSAAFTPALINGITIHPENPLEFDFIVGTGDEKLQGKAFEDESTKLIKYFLASLTVPEDEMWVNLSPYEKDRIIPTGFGTTEMGRDLLAQDYILKQLTASLMYPEKELGSEFWKKIYQKAYEQYGTTEIPMNTFNKVWIVPQKAVVYEHGNSAFVVKSHLKVMLEEDYMVASHQSSDVSHQKKAEDQNLTTEDRRLTTQVIREVILPAIEKEVNEGKGFANLRQIYNSAILAAWFKQNLRQTLLGQVYVDKTKTKGVDLEDKTVNDRIYAQYLEAFQKGVYNYIKEDYDPATKEVIPRKYFSGGTTMKVGDLVETYKDKQPLAREQQEIVGEYLAGLKEYNQGMVSVNLVELSEDMSVAEAQELIASSKRSTKKTSSPMEEAANRLINSLKPLNDQFLQEFTHLESDFSSQRLTTLETIVGKITSAVRKVASMEDRVVVGSIEDVFNNKIQLLLNVISILKRDDLGNLKKRFETYLKEFQNFELIVERGELRNIERYTGFGKFTNLENLPGGGKDASASSPVTAQEEYSYYQKCFPGLIRQDPEGKYYIMHNLIFYFLPVRRPSMATFPSISYERLTDALGVAREEILDSLTIEEIENFDVLYAFLMAHRDLLSLQRTEVKKIIEAIDMMRRGEFVEEGELRKVRHALPGLGDKVTGLLNSSQDNERTVNKKKPSLEEVLKKFVPGEAVILRKIDILPGKQSSVPLSSIMVGFLGNDVSEGRGIVLSNGGRTSNIKKIVETMDASALKVQTDTSTYEIKILTEITDQLISGERKLQKNDVLGKNNFNVVGIVTDPDSGSGTLKLKIHTKDEVLEESTHSRDMQDRITLGEYRAWEIAASSPVITVIGAAGGGGRKESLMTFVKNEFKEDANYFFVGDLLIALTKILIERKHDAPESLEKLLSAINFITAKHGDGILFVSGDLENAMKDGEFNRQYGRAYVETVRHLFQKLLDDSAENPPEDLGLFIEIVENYLNQSGSASSPVEEAVNNLITSLRELNVQFQQKLGQLTTDSTGEQFLELRKIAKNIESAVDGIGSFSDADSLGIVKAIQSVFKSKAIALKKGSKANLGDLFNRYLGEFQLLEFIVKRGKLGEIKKYHSSGTLILARTLLEDQLPSPVKKTFFDGEWSGNMESSYDPITDLTTHDSYGVQRRGGGYVIPSFRVTEKGAKANRPADEIMRMYRNGEFRSSSPVEGIVIQFIKSLELLSNQLKEEFDQWVLDPSVVRLNTLKDIVKDIKAILRNFEGREKLDQSMLRVIDDVFGNRIAIMATPIEWEFEGYGVPAFRERFEAYRKEVENLGRIVAAGELRNIESYWVLGHFANLEKLPPVSSPVGIEKDGRRRIKEIKDESVTEKRVARLLDGLHEGDEFHLTLFLAEWMEEAQIDFKQYGEGKKIYVNESFEPGENILLGWGERAIAVTKANLWRMTADLAERNLEVAGYFLGEMEENLSATSSPAKNRVQGSGDRVRVTKDDGRMTKDEVGGINLNPALLDLQIKRDGNGVPLPLPMQPIENMHIEGFLPVIINVTPIVNLPLLLGLADAPVDIEQSAPALKAREIEPVSLLN